METTPDAFDIIKNNLVGDKIAIDDILKAITPQQKLQLMARLKGFTSMPPTIEEFIMDDYYLGKHWKNKLFKYWIPHFKAVCPNPIEQPYMIINPSGALGIGKSVFSQILSQYTICKMGFLNDPYETFGLGLTTPFTIRCFNLTMGKAYEVLIGPINDQLNSSPYFMEYKRLNGTLPGNIQIKAAKTASQVISECLVFALVSETNFFKYHVAEDIVNTCITRMSSRLQKVKGLFGTIILDSSTTTKDSYVESFLGKGEYIDTTYVVRASIWDVKPDYYFKEGSFKVYAGSSDVQPHIMKDDEDTTGYDLDRIITVPNELLNNFRTDIEKSLMDSAGICLDSVNTFFTDKEKLKEAMCLEQPFEDIQVFDFFDDEGIKDRLGSKIKSLLPDDRKLFCRIDLGLTGDLCGISIGHIDSIERKKIMNKSLLIPHIKIPISFGLSRIPGQETSIHKIIEFFLWLSEKYEIGMISTDQFQSSAIRQAFTEHGIPTRLLSVDRTDTPYVNMKNLIARGHLQLVNSELLNIELYNLQRVGNKVDHLAQYSKDIADTCAGIVQDIIDAGESAADVPVRKTFESYNKMMKDLSKNASRKSALSRLGLR